MLFSSGNRVAFANAGGLTFNGKASGICWWHSRFQRAATYLTIFEPSSARPTKPEVLKIVDAIIEGRTVSLIPGFNDLAEFTEEHKDLIQQRLEGWQKRDTFGLQFLRGLQGNSQIGARELRKRMDDLYDAVENKNQIVYQMLQLPGVNTHAHIVHKVVRFAKGYRIYAVDSSDASAQKPPITYHDGDTQLNNGGYDYVPYTQFESENTRHLTGVMAYCNPAWAKEKWLRAARLLSSREKASNIPSAGGRSPIGIARTPGLDSAIRAVAAGGEIPTPLLRILEPQESVLDQRNWQTLMKQAGW